MTPLASAVSLALALGFASAGGPLDPRLRGGSPHSSTHGSGAPWSHSSAAAWTHASAAEVVVPQVSALASSGSAWTPVRIGWVGSQPGDFGFPGGDGVATCLDVAMSTRDASSPALQVYRCNGKDGQLFLVDTSGQSSMPQIKWAANPSKCLDVKDGHQTPQERRHVVTLHDCHPEGHADRVNQAFSVQFMDSWMGHMVWLGNGANQCVDNWNGVVNTQTEHASQIATWPCHAYSDGTAGIDQLWYQYSEAAPTPSPAPTPANCGGIFAANVCDSTPGCSWCSRPPAACVSSDGDACAN